MLVIGYLPSPHLRNPLPVWISDQEKRGQPNAGGPFCSLPTGRLGLEVKPQTHGDQSRTILRTGRSAEVGVADRAVHAEIRLIERVEGVGAQLEAQLAAVSARP